MTELYKQMSDAISHLVDYRPHWSMVTRMVGDSPLGYEARIQCKAKCCNVFFVMKSDGYTKSLHEITDPFNEHFSKEHDHGTDV